MTKEQAIAEFRRLVARHGLRWTASVPQESYAQLAKVNAVLTTEDRREALGLQRR